MQKHKKKLIITLLITAVLAGAWFYSDLIAPNPVAIDPPYEPMAEQDALAYTNKPTFQADELEQASESHADEAAESIETTTEEDALTPHTEAAPSEAVNSEETATMQAPAQTPAPTPPPTPTPVPTPDPNAPFAVTLEVRVDTILSNMSMLSAEKHELVPANGVIFPRTQVTAHPGESVFDVLQREMRRAGIHMSSRWTPVFNSAYVEAIHNIFEFDVGPLSGWMYRVNGRFPNFGSSLYELSPGDAISWLYTVDLGRDLGAGQGAGQGR